jgi:DNA-binding CsgD family transcriptional regulator
VTARELEILRLLGRGDKIAEVANALEISYKTVANTTSLLKQKLGAKSHSDLIRIAVEMGLDWRPAGRLKALRQLQKSFVASCVKVGGPAGAGGLVPNEVEPYCWNEIIR